VFRKQQIHCVGNSSRAPGEIKKSIAKLNLNNLPFNMLRKIPGGLNATRKRKNKKQGKKSKEARRCEGLEAESDAIQSSEEGLAQPQSCGTVGAEFELEVVLPFHCAVEEAAPSLARKVGSSGVEHLINGGGFIVDDYQSAKSHGSDGSDTDVPFSREIYEAKKLIEINEKLGVKFLDGGGADVDRMVAMEARDRSEKFVREQNGGYQ
jgi:hypothetical protein